jgi:GH25 family lysozyme M1 (1,4-beta-N-acetylmuramidase)
VPIDWAAVKSGGQSFAFVKATEGGTYTNPYFDADWAAVHDAGLYRGAYHFARPSAALGDATAEAERFLAAIGTINQPGDLPPVLDLEDSGGLSPAELTAWTRTFLTTVEAATGRTPIIYTYSGFWATAMGGSTGFTRYPLWIAGYGLTAPSIGGWTGWTFWQFTSTGTVSGIPTTGNTDVDRFNGTDTDLARLALVPQGPTLSLDATPRVPYGGTVDVSGRVHDADGTPLATGSVEIYQQIAGSPDWTLLTSVPADVDGTYHYAFQPQRSVRLSARIPLTGETTSTTPPTTAPPVTVRVAATVEAHWSTRITLGRTAHLRATVQPTALVSRQIWTGTRWKTVARAHPDQAGRIHFPVPVSSATYYRQRVVATTPGVTTAVRVLPRFRAG